MHSGNPDERQKEKGRHGKAYLCDNRERGRKKPDAARIAEVTIGNKLTTATLRILADTAEISVTLEDRDIEYYKETYIFTPAPNMLELPID